MNDSKQTLQWFENRIGQWIYRAPIFISEMSRPYIAMKIKDNKHAKLLFDLQRSGRPGYVDNAKDVQRQHARP
jgi:hypothetical protein